MYSSGTPDHDTEIRKTKHSNRVAEHQLKTMDNAMKIANHNMVQEKYVRRGIHEIAEHVKKVFITAKVGKTMLLEYPQKRPCACIQV